MGLASADAFILGTYPLKERDRIVSFRLIIPDRPGVLSGITQALGAEKINIEDFELHHLTPERGGTLSVLIAGEEAARRAAELLESQGYGVIVSPAFED